MKGVYNSFVLKTCFASIFMASCFCTCIIFNLVLFVNLNPFSCFSAQELSSQSEDRKQDFSNMQAAGDFLNMFNIEVSRISVTLSLFLIFLGLLYWWVNKCSVFVYLWWTVGQFLDNDTFYVSFLCTPPHLAGNKTLVCLFVTYCSAVKIQQYILYVTYYVYPQSPIFIDSKVIGQLTDRQGRPVPTLFHGKLKRS